MSKDGQGDEIVVSPAALLRARDRYFPSVVLPVGTTSGLISLLADSWGGVHTRRRFNGTSVHVTVLKRDRLQLGDDEGEEA